ncbi:tRNA (N(6)-L-threonylcarbamoyladenosine(37)-C(2))-methylthiotransferase MtaB [Alloacidobacterium dinghuense]|uniref:tRNA (N(6)-L-threonylcarbamoyladenosine(37)-C(2))-methylthiotransferase MtaB n=1 Tax=Alloacidobacterium dinghuense TaxID=2763107 RepID=A0A7G8BHA3_9BACT|nr:tRNA (N(6)-L-threonylcarbamoyladenosine(37)-C(2))-methylthiotransferase MtaB [Alloacidobacterium dinghuense]QNI31923.1 tRNA (N(6)-L-threonylcarbamoyladenosine(37)-C(2))-methylthiotransferase MtaB [Alloacidobacterium dinghuense]
MAEYHVENFGCRSSRSDGEAIAAELRHRGLKPATDFAGASVVVVNTCSVTADADSGARAFIRRVHRKNPDAKIVVTGCYAQRAPEELATLSGVTSVIGNSHKSLVASIIVEPTAFVPLATVVNRVPVFVDESFAHTDLATLPFADDADQTRPNLKVQDGCANCCSFCIIPETRGPSRSITLEKALESVERFVQNGGQELVLSGINLGRWGRDLKPAKRFADLVSAILERTVLPRLRLSSIEPMDWTEDLLALFATHTSRLARHAHLPLQSGSDTILRRMYRRYRPWHYAEKLSQIRSLMPDAAIGADVMVGFPGETDALFQESYDFIAAQPLTYLHLFPFSPRLGTPAAELQRYQPVHKEVMNQRMDALRALAEGKNTAFRKSFLGRELSVVTLRGNRSATTPALSDNFIKVEVAMTYPPNRSIQVRATRLTESGLHAVPLAE